jgi:hypothetical protein
VEYLDGPRHFGEFVGALPPIGHEVEVALRQAQRQGRASDTCATNAGLDRNIDRF